MSRSTKRARKSGPGAEHEAEGLAQLLPRVWSSPGLAHLLSEFRPVLEADAAEPAPPFAGDSDWFVHVELWLYLAAMRNNGFMELAAGALKADTTTPAGAHTADRASQSEQLELLERLVAEVSAAAERRLQATGEAPTPAVPASASASASASGAAAGAAAGAEAALQAAAAATSGTEGGPGTPGWRPRIFRVAQRYKLSSKEQEMLQYLVVAQGAQTNTIRNYVLEDDGNHKLMSYQRTLGVSAAELEEFKAETRPHVKEGTVLVDEESYSDIIKMSSIAVHVLLGHPLTPDQQLKLSQTELEAVLLAEGAMQASSVAMDGVEATGDDLGFAAAGADAIGEVSENALADLMKDTPSTPGASTPGGESTPAAGAAAAAAGASAGLVTPTSAMVAAGATAGELGPYAADNQLEYLEEMFSVLGFRIRAANARMKEDMKEAGERRTNHWENNSGQPTAGRRELKAKQRVQERRVAVRLAATRAAGIELPRLERMASKLFLDSFEKQILVLLIGKTISPVVKTLLDTIHTGQVERFDETITINQALAVFFDTFQEQVTHRTHFYKSGRLLQRGLIKVVRARWHQGGDLVDQRIELDRRILDWVVGLDTEINEICEGSDLYVPKVTMDMLVLPAEVKTQILESVRSFETFRTYRKTQGLDEVISYGSSLVILLCGQSGTGKTMTVNAVANSVNKRVLLVDFPSLQGKRFEGGGDADADLRGLFREAEMSNAVIFFDECESIFKTRQVGGDRLLNALLTEMERYEGIVFLATNRPHDLDEAMHRRITSVFEFQQPDHLQRREIWRVLANDRIPLAEEIDWEDIALKYELSGGFIKNAVLSALLKAIARDGAAPVVTQEDIVAGCSLQMRGSLQMRTFDHRVLPTSGLDALVLSSKLSASLQSLVQMEKAKSVVFGQWRFSEAMRQRQGATALFVGPSGAGKLSAAKAIGFEIGRPLKVVKLDQLIGESRAATTKSIAAVFDDARLMDAVVVVTGVREGVLQSQELDREVEELLERMERFPGISVLLLNARADHEVAPSFARFFKFVVPFATPGPQLRQRLWRAMVPETAPLADDVNFAQLGTQYEFSPATMSAAVFRAAAVAALRTGDAQIIRMSDLEEAAQVERRKQEGSHFASVSRMFL